MKHERWLLSAMLATVLLVGFTMLHDEQRESEVAFVALGGFHSATG